MAGNNDGNVMGSGVPGPDSTANQQCEDRGTYSSTGLWIPPTTVATHHTGMGQPGAVPNIIPTGGVGPQVITGASIYGGVPIMPSMSGLIPAAQPFGFPGGNAMIRPVLMPLIPQAPFGAVVPRPPIGIPVQYPPVLGAGYQAVGTPYHPSNPYALNTQLPQPVAVRHAIVGEIGGNTSTRQAGAGRAIGKLNAVLNSPANSKNFTIRAKGKDNDHTTVYNIINWNNSRVNGTLVVDGQTETVQLRDSDGLHVMTANGGLFNPNDAMNISWPSNEQLAAIDATGIHILPSIRLSLGSRDTAQGQVFTIFDQLKTVVSSITQYKDAAKTTLIDQSLNNCISLIIFLYTLKIFYIRFNLHRLPMPFGILSNINRSAYRHLPPSLDILHHLGNIRMRLASHIKLHHFFADFMDKISGRIFLVAAVKSHHIEFKDPCGMTHFFGHLGKGTSLRVSSPPPAEEVYGRITGNNTVLDPTGVEIMTIFNQALDGTTLSEREDKPGKIAFYAPDRTQKYAEVALDNYVLSMDMGIPLSPTIKALILTKAVRMAMFCYRIEEQVSPRVVDYSYAKIG